MQHRRNWCQPPFPTARRPSRGNGGAPVPTPANIGPFNPPLSDQRPIQSIHPIQPVSNQSAHKIQFLLANLRPIKIRSSRYDPSDIIQTIQPIRSSRYNPGSVSSEGNPKTRISLTRKTHPQLTQLIIFHPPQKILPNVQGSSKLTLNMINTKSVLRD